MTDGDITWAQMWAEEERQRRIAAEAAWQSNTWQAAAFEPSGRAEAVRSEETADAASGLTLAPEPYFGGQTPHYPEPQPYFELSADPVGSHEDAEQPPALRVTLPAAPAPSRRPDADEEPVDGLDEIDWQAPPPTASASPSGPEPAQGDRGWGSTWADGIHKHRPKHAR